MTITGGSALPKEEVERMMKEAEQYAEEDAKRKEEAETRNQAEALVHQTQKFLAENGDKVPAEGKADVEAALADLNGVLGTSDVEAIRAKAAVLAEKSQALGGALYAQSAGANPDEDTLPAEDDTVVDAEIVDEEK